MDEILPPPLRSRDEADPLIKRALKHFNAAKRATIQTMADLRRLQDGQVHSLYGYTNFGKWCEDTFDGLAAGNVRQLCRAGAVALELDRRGLIDLENPGGVGTRGLRELSAVANTYGNDKMAEVFITAREISTGEVSEVNVTAAMRTLMPPAQAELPALVEQVREVDEADLEYDSGYDWYTVELIDQIRDLAYDLPRSLPDLREAVKQLESQLTEET